MRTCGSEDDRMALLRVLSDSILLCTLFVVSSAHCTLHCMHVIGMSQYIISCATMRPSPADSSALMVRRELIECEHSPNHRGTMKTFKQHLSGMHTACRVIRSVYKVTTPHELSFSYSHVTTTPVNTMKSRSHINPYYQGALLNP